MSAPIRPPRMKTGIPGLDHLLEGGLVRGNSLLVEGAPGSGKTTFAIRTIFEGVVQFDEPGLVITFEEFPRQIYQEALGAGVDLAALERAGKLRVVWTPPSRILDGFLGKSDLIAKIVQDLGVKRLAIDSITHFKRVAHDEVKLREALADMLNWIKLRGINSILVKELEKIDDATIAFEEYLVDASLRVHNSGGDSGGENVRTVEVRKTRGQGHVSGRHPFTLSNDGIRVYPRLRPADVRPRGAAAAPRVKVTSGVPGVDAMLGGGLWNGSLNLLLGAPGAGKSVFANHFLEAGLRVGEPCLLMSFRQNEQDAVESARTLDMDWSGSARDGVLRVLHWPASGVTVEQVVGALYDATRERTPGRLVLDSADDLWSLARDEDRVRDALRVIGEISRAAGITALCLHELRPRGAATNSHGDDADLASCVIQLSLVETEGELRRFLGIRKMAGAEHANELREFSIGANGIRIERKPTGLSGILAGDARGRLNDVADSVLPHLEGLGRLFASLDREGADAAAARDSVREARAHLATIDVLLREHFGLTNFRTLAEEFAPPSNPVSVASSESGSGRPRP